MVRVSDCQCQSRNSPGCDPSILWHSVILGVAAEAVLNEVLFNVERSFETDFRVPGDFLIKAGPWDSQYRHD